MTTTPKIPIIHNMAHFKNPKNIKYKFEDLRPMKIESKNLKDMDYDIDYNKSKNYHGMIAQELESVQPLPLPTGMLYYLDFVYGDGTIILKTKRNRKLNIIIL